MKRFFALACIALALSFPAAANGPNGLGALKLGMSKESVEGLQANEGVYLNGSLSVQEQRCKARRR